MAIKEVKNSQTGFNYFKGLGTGVATAFFASFLFALFGFIYLTWIDPGFIDAIHKNELLGIYINKYGASFQIFMEGSASGCLMSYAAMQYLKQPRLCSSKEPGH